MLDADRKLQEHVHQNARRIQSGMDRMLDHKALQIDGVQFRLRTRMSVEGDNQALGLVLMGRDDRGEWLPCHA
tara:strand:- start:733 stop:951 length:219 start_codon:yes stop_codon:yes gene_type:complete